MWFHRDYQRLTGGHLKHAHYFDHVARLPGFAPRLVLGGAAPSAERERQRLELWPVPRERLAQDWTPAEADVLFLAGTDWRYLDRLGLADVANPRINLIQGVRHAHAGSELRGYLARRAIRICVSAEVADAISATGEVAGPVVTIRNGIDLNAGRVRRDVRRNAAIFIAGYKRPELAASLSDRLSEARIPHRATVDFVARQTFLESLAASDIAVCVPLKEEGFYLPALEAMASGCVTVTLDCIGNRGFAKHGVNCFVAEDDAGSLARAVQAAYMMSARERAAMLASAADTAAAHSLDGERRRFHALLQDVDDWWRAA